MIFCMEYIWIWIDFALDNNLMENKWPAPAQDMLRDVNASIIIFKTI